ncbi:hypothetical protein TNCV_227711 [Trichonephila clavipes]|nr:hypothetical protein TNCV_227711 [Trichonephila clavipes]
MVLFNVGTVLVQVYGTDAVYDWFGLFREGKDNFDEESISTSVTTGGISKSPTVSAMDIGEFGNQQGVPSLITIWVSAKLAAEQKETRKGCPFYKPSSQETRASMIQSRANSNDSNETNSNDMIQQEVFPEEQTAHAEFYEAGFEVVIIAHGTCSPSVV